MRLLSLGLDRYGRFADRRLDFDPAAKVVVVLGGNEAGKTTALHAACDALYGIEERSRFNFIYDYKDMRLSATIAGNDGRVLSFTRLKRRQATLVHPDSGQPLPDDVLAPFLGAHGRAAFLDIFGLDQRRLREGGAKLLAGGGDLAEALIAAAPGLGRIAVLRDRLKADAAEVFNPDRRSAKALFYVAVDRYKDANRRMEDTELRGDEVKAVRAAAEAATLARDAAVAEESKAAGLANQAQILRGAARELRIIAAAEARGEELGPLPEVEAGFPDAAEAALAAHARTVAAASAAAEAETLARSARSAIVPDAAILAEAQDITRCDEERVQVEDRRTSLPNRRREADAYRVGLARIATALGLDGVVTLRARLPGPPLLARAQALADQLRDHATRCAAFDDEGEILARARRDMDIAALPSVDDPAPLKQALDALDGAETRATTRATQRRKRDAVRANLDARMARLPFGPWTRETLSTCPLPDRPAVEGALARYDTTVDLLARQTEQLARLEEQTALLVARRAVLDAAGTAPTAFAVADAREARDGLWRNLRPVLLGQRPATGADATGATAFEQALAAADRLADGRLSESQRLADLARVAVDLVEAETSRTHAEARVRAAETDRLAAREAWTRLWAPLLAPAPEAGAIAFLREAEAIRAANDDLAREEAEATPQDEACAWDRRAADTLRAALGLPPLGDAPLRMTDLRAAVAERERAFQQHRDALRDRARLDRDMADLSRRRAELKARRENLATELAAVFPPLAIRAEATPDEARAALGLWYEAATLHEQLVTAERRIAGIEQDEAHFVGAMEALLQRLQSPAGDDPVAAARALRARLDIAREARTRAEAADARLSDCVAASAAARVGLEQAEAVLRQVLARAGTDDAATLPVLIDKLRQAAESRAAVREARARLADLMGDRGIEEIRSAIAGRDDDALTRHVAEMTDAHVRAREARDVAIAADAKTQAALEALDTRAGAAAAAQEMQDAATDMDVAMARFIRSHAAARLLAHAIERYRDAHQNPIVARAADAFATLTGGRWSGIAIDYDSDPPRLAAARDGNRFGVDALSEGTADQLFLALRVAAIKDHARRATPLPFLADDIFVSFDEARTEAGMTLLGELGATTQVIVFTHHAHVAACATRALGAATTVLRF